MQQQQHQIQRIQAKLKGRAQMLEGQAAEIEELTLVMRAKINDDSTAARWGRDGEVERQRQDPSTLRKSRRIGRGGFRTGNLKSIWHVGTAVRWRLRCALLSAVRTDPGRVFACLLA